MKKSIYTLTTALLFASPSLTLEARAGNPFLAAQEALNQGKAKQTQSQSYSQKEPSKKKNPFVASQEALNKGKEQQIVVYRTEKPAEGTLVDLTKRTSDKYIRYTNLEERAEQILTPIPEPPVAQEYPAAQYASQPQYVQTEQPGVCRKVQPMPEVCKPVQKTVQVQTPTPMLIQGAPEVIVQPQTVYAPTIVLPSPTVVAQTAVPVVPVRVHSCNPGYAVYRTCVARPFGGLFRGIAIAARWLVAGPRHIQAYIPANPYYPMPMFNAPVMGPGPVRPVPMGGPMGVHQMGISPVIRPGMGVPMGVPMRPVPYGMYRPF